MAEASDMNMKRAMIIGLGKTGLSCARFLAAQGYAVAVTDSRESPPALEAIREELPDAAIFVGGFSDVALAHSDLVVVSPGIPLHDPFVSRVRESGVEMVGDIELFARVATRPVVAVTGSNGKSTVATLFGRMAETAGRKVGLGGNLGQPALELLDDDNLDMYVLELSSFQLESTTSLKPAASVILNITPDHIDWHGSMDAYANAKARVFSNAAVCVFNRDDEWSRKLGCERENAVSFGFDAPKREIDFGICRKDGEDWLCRGTEALISVERMHLAGSHNHANALACLALGYAVGLAKLPMLDALRRFTGLKHRMEWLGERDGVVYVNDSKGTNVGATQAAILGAARPLVLIAGGDGKGQDFGPLGDAMRDRVHDLVLLGKSADAIAAVTPKGIRVNHASSMEEAVRVAAESARPGDMVLLSPACSSLDMFSNYEARGEAFSRAVQELDA